MLIQRTASRLLFVVVSLSQALAACGETLPEGQDAPCTANVASDPLNCGRCGNACAARDSCVNGACVAAPPDLALFVDASKTNDGAGCTRDKPCGSIKLALNEAAKQSLTNQEIRVCKGTYLETQLVLDRTMSIRGGFDCTTWVRDEQVLHPTFGMTNEVRIQNGAPQASSVTLEVRGPDVARAAIIDGLHIVGDSDVEGASAVRVIGGANPTITDDVIDVTSSKRREGIIVVNSGPEIRKTRITNIAVEGAFTGMFLDKATAKVHDNIIDGRAGKESFLGIWMRLGSAIGDDAIKANQIRWETARSSATGILVTNAGSVEVMGNTVEQGTVTCDGTGLCQAIGIDVLEVESGVINANRVRGARSEGLPDFALSGIRVSLSGSIEIVNNMVHTGNLLGRDTSGAVAISAAASKTPTPGPVTIAHNTIVLHDPIDMTARGVSVLANAKDIAVDHNLFVASIGRSATATVPGSGSVAIFEVPGGTFKSIRGNAFVNTSKLFRAQNTAMRDHDTIAKLQGDAALMMKATENVQINTPAICTTPANDCIATCEASGCAAAFLAPWNDGTGANDVLASGFRLQSNLCKIVRGAKGVPGPSASRDHFAIQRNDPSSIGAAEREGGCAE